MKMWVGFFFCTGCSSGSVPSLGILGCNFDGNVDVQFWEMFVGPDAGVGFGSGGELVEAFVISSAVFWSHVPDPRGHQRFGSAELTPQPSDVERDSRQAGQTTPVSGDGGL